MNDSDVPGFTGHEERALIYIYEVENQQLAEEDAPTISQLSDLTGWDNRYYTRAWKRLEPKGLLNRMRDGQNTRLELTDKGRRVASKLMEINEVLER